MKVTECKAYIATKDNPVDVGEIVNVECNFVLKVYNDSEDCSDYKVGVLVELYPIPGGEEVTEVIYKELKGPYDYGRESEVDMPVLNKELRYSEPGAFPIEVTLTATVENEVLCEAVEADIVDVKK